MRLRIEYFDHNEDFAALLPREGRVIASPACADSTLVWLLLRLDRPLVYGGIEYSDFLLASRWPEHAVGGSKATSVFILLVPAQATPVEAGFSHKQFLHVAWGMAHAIPAVQT